MGLIAKTLVVEDAGNPANDPMPERAISAVQLEWDGLAQVFTITSTQHPGRIVEATPDVLERAYYAVVAMRRIGIENAPPESQFLLVRALSAAARVLLMPQRYGGTLVLAGKATHGA